MDQKYAVIDIGTNSVRLMIAQAAEGKIKSLYKALNTVRIGEGMGKSNCITDAAIKRTTAALSQYKNEAEKAGVKELFVFATSAVREAQNKQEFLNEAYSQCGLTIDVLSGEEEAKTGFLGAAGRNKKSGIIDIGGGSTEVICGKDDELTFVKSFLVGTVRALSLFPENDAGEGLQKVRAWVDREIAELKSMKALKNIPFIGIGGTATALASIALGLKTYDSKKVQGYVLAREKLDEVSHMLLNLTVDERKNVTGLDEKRADVIVYGCLILAAFMDAVGLDKIKASDRDNQEGYLLKKLGL